MRQAKCCRIYAEAESNASLLAIAEVLQYMRQTKCCRIYSKRNNIVIQAILHSIFGKQNAAEYMQKPRVDASLLGNCRGATVYAANEVLPNILKEEQYRNSSDTA